MIEINEFYFKNDAIVLAFMFIFKLSYRTDFFQIGKISGAEFNN